MHAAEARSTLRKTHHSRNAFGSFNLQKEHAVVARSTFRSQHIKNTSASEHCKKLRCSKSPRGCKTPHSQNIFGSWDVEKKCIPLWHEEHSQVESVKNVKNWQSRTTFGSWDVEKVHVAVARSRFQSENPKNTMFGPLLEVEMLKNCTQLWREAHWEVNMCKTHHMFGPFLDVEPSSFCGRRNGFRTMPKDRKQWKTWGLPSKCKNDGKRGTFEEDLDYTLQLLTTAIQLQLH